MNSLSEIATNEKLNGGSSLCCQADGTLKIPTLKPGGLDPLTVDISQDPNAIEILQALAGGG